MEKVKEGKVESKIKLSATKSAKLVGSHTESMSVEGLSAQSLKDDEEKAKTLREPVQDELALQHAKQTGVHNILNLIEHHNHIIWHLNRSLSSIIYLNITFTLKKNFHILFTDKSN